MAVGFNYASYGRSWMQPENLLDRLKIVLGVSENSCCTLSLKHDGIAVFNAVTAAEASAASSASAASGTSSALLPLTTIVVHGESIGGMVAVAIASSPAAQEAPVPKKLLVVDRSFWSLNAVAQRMLHPFLGILQHSTAPGWTSDVVADYALVPASWRRLLAYDAVGDGIIHYEASFVSGVSVRRTIACGAGWKFEIDGDDWSTLEGWEERVRRNTQPDDEEIELLKKSFPREHLKDKMRLFAGAVRAIGIRTTRMNKEMKYLSQGGEFSDDESSDEDRGERDEGGERREEDVERGGRAVVPYFQDLNVVWSNLSLCDGLAGITLGAAAKMSRDGVYCWVSSSLEFGASVVLSRIRDRMKTVGNMEGKVWEVVDADWGGAHGGRCRHGAVSLPQCLKGVALMTDRMSAAQEIPPELLSDLEIVVDMLEYIKKEVAQKATGSDWRRRLVREVLVNLTGGHNTPWESHEQAVLERFLNEE